MERSVCPRCLRLSCYGKPPHLFNSAERLEPCPIQCGLGLSRRDAGLTILETGKTAAPSYKATKPDPTYKIQDTAGDRIVPVIGPVRRGRH